MLVTDEQQQIADAVRAFAQERLKPFAEQWDKEHRFPKEAIEEMAELGLFGAAGDGACSTIMSVHNSVGCVPILRFGSEQQKAQFLTPLATGAMLGAFALTEPQAGSDASSLKARARLDGDHYVLNGSKQFITSGQNAGVVIVFAVTDPEAGKRGISAFIVPTDSPGYQVARVEDKLGQHASDTCQIVFDNVRVPVANRLGAEGEGYKIALANLEGGRIGIASQAVGMARAAFEVARDYANERQSFGKALIEHQAVAFRLADMATKIAVARQMVLHAAALRDAGRPALVEASMAKLFASEMAEKVCSDALQTLGGYGYLSDFPLERIYRDVRVCQIYEGTSDIQRMVIARNL
ncbi:acyl-CoA dehydrogenase [Pseudomonas putida]|uniref:acyl-CoA dehydrogenase n=1 Tax=Pseudomonas putida TaxID=303 RepID=UPI00216738D9|nr:acyl-CoA dehydrogenase [Pseudomonas putida]MCS4062522.1 alkylation response protein AidB-like acyl-CoA dehydrogenase [Pseudomonas putida]